MRITAILITAFVVGQTMAQDITEYRYWYNDDAANAVTQTVSPSSELALATTLPTGTMAPGFHRIIMQFNDGQNWSVPLTQMFKRSSAAITGYRYWFNDDVATLATASVPPNALVNLNGVLNSIPSDRHYNWVTVQFVDADGEYSTPITHTYVRGIGPVSGYEYWIDDDIAGRTSGTVGPADVVDLIANLPTNTIPGDHLFTIRFMGDPDGWSVPLTTEYSFYTTITELPGLTDVTVFPNPAAESIGIRMSSTTSRTLNVSVLDAHGALVKQFPAWNVNGTDHRNWDISTLPAGAYFLQVSEEGKSWNRPFVKR
ncbi:MAG: T9SS type A sorting domain-containing protein [Flavobacteriales bacterium]